MSMTRANAKLYISKGIGGQNQSGILQMAEEALQRTFEDWQAAKDWYFMLKDTAGQYVAASFTVTNGSPDITPVTSGTADFVNPGMTITASAQFTGTLTVLSVTRDPSTGIVTKFTVDQNAAGSATITLTFPTLNIPLQVGVQEYSLPLDFLSPYHSRMLGKRLPLDYIQYRYWNMKIIDHTIQGLPVAYTVYNPVSAQTQNYGVYRMRVFRIPQGVNFGDAYDTLYMQYYRKFNHDSDPLDIPDRYLYKFLDYAQWKLLEKKDATSDRLPVAQSSALAALQSAMTDDQEVTEEEEQTRLVSQMEAGLIPRPLWSNSQFSIFYGEL